MKEKAPRGGGAEGDSKRLRHPSVVPPRSQSQELIDAVASIGRAPNRRRPRTVDAQGWSADPEHRENVAKAKARLDELERLAPEVGPRPSVVFLASGREAAAHEQWERAALSWLFHHDEKAYREFRRRTQ